MFELALLIGVYSYSILFLGLLGFLSKSAIFITTFIFSVVAIFHFKDNLKNWKKYPAGFTGRSLKFYSLLVLFSGLALVNLIGALGPELAFDALWYHLTLPKLYLLKGYFYFIPGGTLYYSTMPQMTEMLYLAGMALHSEIFAKLTHYSFGLLVCWSIFKIARNYLNLEFSLLAVIIFYSNLVVAWESTTAYIDLARTFFELLAFWAFIKWMENKYSNWLICSGLMIGLAISTKLLSIGTLILYLILIFFYLLKIKQSWIKIFSNLAIYLAVALLVPMPFFLHSFINRGNPFYPLFSADLQTKTPLPSLNPSIFLNDLWQVLTNAADPISPVYIVLLPLSVIVFRKFKPTEKIFFYFSLLSLILWYVTPRTGGGRFLLPFLPVLSILIVLTLNILKNQKFLLRVSVIFIILISFSTILFRGAANLRYIDYILGRETKEAFLAKHLEFEYGNFADIDGYFAKNIKPEDRVLLYGFHNLYYVNFPFIDGSWVKEGDRFNYIAVKEGELPSIFKDWQLIYLNQKTQVRLYSNEGKFWIYTSLK